MYVPSFSALASAPEPEPPDDDSEVEPAAGVLALVLALPDVLPVPSGSAPAEEHPARPPITAIPASATAVFCRVLVFMVICSLWR